MSIAFKQEEVGQELFDPLNKETMERKEVMHYAILPETWWLGTSKEHADAQQSIALGMNVCRTWIPYFRSNLVKNSSPEWLPTWPKEFLTIWKFSVPSVIFSSQSDKVMWSLSVTSRIGVFHFKTALSVDTSPERVMQKVTTLMVKNYANLLK